jgi:tripartite ATP-independent transporter DctP family solute receptor
VRRDRPAVAFSPQAITREQGGAMKRRDFVRFCASSAVVGTGLAPGMSRAQDKVVWKASDVHPLGYPTVEAIERMGRKLSKETNGRISIQMFPSMQLGGEKEMIEQAQVGALQIARISVGAMGPVVDDLNVFNLPFIFRDEQHMRKVIDGPIGQELLDRISASPTSRLIVLGWMDAGTRNVYSNKPVTKPADLKGMKIRMMGNPIFVETMNAMGGNGVAMGFNELYSALQTGVVDGAENNQPTVLAQNHFQVSKVYSLTGHLIIPEIFVFSKRTWDGLSKEDQALVRKLSREAQMEQRQLWDAMVAEAETKLKAQGVQFVQADKPAFYKATQPIRDKYGAKYAALLKRIEATT